MSIVIPETLRPADGRFGCGPSKVRADQLEVIGEALTKAGPGDSARLVRRIRDGLGELFGLPDGYQVVLGAGGPSAFWDVAAYGLVRRRSQHLSFGVFSSMFAEVCRRAPWLDPPDIRESPVGSHPWPSAEAGVDVYALTHCETSTGVAMPIRRVDGADDDALVVVDATSAAGGLAVDPAAFDVYFFGPQKCFGAEAGLWGAVLSPAALDRAAEIARDRYVPASLSLTAAIEDSARDRAPGDVSAVGLVLFAEQVGWMLGRGGLDWCTARTAASADRLYGWARESSYARPFVGVPEQRSAVAGTIDLDAGVNAQEVIAVLRENGIVDLGANRKWGPNQIRVGMYPAVDPADVEALTHCVDYVVARLPGVRVGDL